jgi:transposase-like protein
MAHRIRHAMSKEPLAGLLGQGGGVVEVDEFYAGATKVRKGTPKGKRGRGTERPAVVALVERGGRVRSHPIERVDGKTLKSAIRENVDKSAAIHTDELRSYKGIGKEFDGGHHSVNHSAEEFARGDVTTNSVESYFALLRRGLIGSFHHVSKKHLGRYCDEFSFRWDHRKIGDSERTADAIKGAEGKRLMYRQPIGQ